jgi:hypothetical protein
MGREIQKLLSEFYALYHCTYARTKHTQPEYTKVNRKVSECACRSAEINAVRKLAVVLTTNCALSPPVTVGLISGVCLQIIFRDGGTAFEIHRCSTANCDTIFVARRR